jgi:hypothetical protein
MIELLKQALEAFEIAAEGGRVHFHSYAEALRQAIKELESQEPQGVQVSPKQFVESTFGNRHLVGRPVIWAEWPSREKNT